MPAHQAVGASQNRAFAPFPLGWCDSDSEAILPPVRKRYFLITAFGLVVVLTSVMLTSSRQNRSRTQQLPDGSFLKIVALSYGTNHSYAEPVPARWQKQLART